MEDFLWKFSVLSHPIIPEGENPSSPGPSSAIPKRHWECVKSTSFPGDPDGPTGPGNPFRPLLPRSPWKTKPLETRRHGWGSS